MRTFILSTTNPDTKEKFARAVGWRYGLLFGVALIVAGWGVDAWQLANASAELAWVKLLAVSVTLFPLAVAAGGLAGRAYPSFLTVSLTWVGWGVVSGFIAGIVPFQVTSTVAGLIDPTVRGLSVFPFTSESQFMAMAAMFVGVIVAFPVALFQFFSTEWAWDRSTADNRLSIGSWLMLLVAVPLALALGATDNAATNSLSAPMVLMNQVIQVAITMPSDLDTSKMPNNEMQVYVAGLSWREKMSGRFTQYLADYDPATFQQSTIDVVFDNGMVLRCAVVQYARYVAGCFDLASNYRALMPQFIQTGAAPCEDCTGQVQPPAAAWQLQHGREFAGVPRVAVAHHSGGVVLVRADYPSGNHAECRFVGANPVRLEECQ
jgi:hypothetical protein